MSQIEKAKLYHVAGPVDKPEQGKLAMEIQFNPNSLKVALANTLKENERGDSSKAAQFIDKSSSTLSIELIFDTTDQFEDGDKQEKRKDVRSMTGAIATEFMYSKDVGDEKVEAKRCMFAWGTFSFIGIMETFDETLDYFSPEGTPLRATVALKLKESRFQFRSEEAKAAKRNTPTLFGAPDRGENNNPSPSNDSVSDANAKAGKDEKEWRFTAMYNGKESPRLPSSTSLSIPTVSATASLKASASVGGGISGGFGAGISAGASLEGGLSAGAGLRGGISAGVSGDIEGGVSGGLSASLDASASGGLSSSLNEVISVTPPAFNFGASSALGTGIPGAFSADLQSGGGFSAGSIVSGGAQLHKQTHSNGSASLSSSLGTGKAVASIKSSSGLGFD